MSEISYRIPEKLKRSFPDLKSGKDPVWGSKKGLNDPPPPPPKLNPTRFKRHPRHLFYLSRVVSEVFDVFGLGQSCKTFYGRSFYCNKLVRLKLLANPAIV